MGFVELLLLAIGLSMDAFAVSVCKGLAMKRLRFRDAAICGVWFGSFQALMPFVGYLLGSRFEQYIRAVSSWIAFILLALIGANMLREALSKEGEVSRRKVERLTDAMKVSTNTGKAYDFESEPDKPVEPAPEPAFRPGEPPVPAFHQSAACRPSLLWQVRRLPRCR